MWGQTPPSRPRQVKIHVSILCSLEVLESNSLISRHFDSQSYHGADDMMQSGRQIRSLFMKGPVNRERGVGRMR